MPARSDAEGRALGFGSALCFFVLWIGEAQQRGGGSGGEKGRQSLYSPKDSPLDRPNRFVAALSDGLGLFCQVLTSDKAGDVGGACLNVPSTACCRLCARSLCGLAELKQIVFQGSEGLLLILYLALA
jgi:hypothetical protein